MTRRRFLAVAAAASTTAFTIPAVTGQGKRRADGLGIGMHSYGAHWKLASEGGAKAPFSDALQFLEYCRDIGAGGVQVTIASRDFDFARRIRAKAEGSGMYFEGQLSLPKNETDVDRFELDVRLAREAGATVVRTACLSGRRYETFASADAFRQFRDQSWKSLVMAEPVLKRHRMRLAIENHKDWFTAELVEILQRMKSEFVGVCVDIGNNIALLEDPVEVVTALAPFAFSTHIKDMGVQEYEEGFLLSEVPLGDGFLDLKQLVGVLRRVNPAVRLNLEMITRDPLKIPCLTPKYWIPMGEVPASRLAHALNLMKTHRSEKPLPHVTGLSIADQLQLEDANVRRSLQYAQKELSL